MAFLFRKRIKFLPGIYFNVGKKGVSFSAGVKGARVTVGRGRTTTSVGIPGTGLSSRTTHRNTAPPPAAEAAPSPTPAKLGWRRAALFWLAVWCALALVMLVLNQAGVAV